MVGRAVRLERRHERQVHRAERPPPPQAAIPSHAALLALQRSAGNAAVARYLDVDPSQQTPSEWPAGAPVRVADDGTMAVRQDGAGGSHAFWATRQGIADADAALGKVGSKVRLREGSGTLAGTAPAYEDLGIPQRSYLTAVDPVNVGNETSGTTMDLYADCGKAAREVMGVGGGGLIPKSNVKATWRVDGKEVATGATDPEGMANEIVEAAFPGKGWEAYRALSPADRDAFDAEHGINAYASPDVGEAFAMDSDAPANPRQLTWTFHWGGVLMSNGEDVVTLENYGVVGHPWQQNQDWTFQMYGGPGSHAPSFHEEHRADAEHGADPSTVEAGKR
jgi:hypothetical protein